MIGLYLLFERDVSFSGGGGRPSRGRFGSNQLRQFKKVPLHLQFEMRSETFEEEIADAHRIEKKR